MFDWDRSNLRKIRAHRISREEAEQALVNAQFRFMNNILTENVALFTTVRLMRGVYWRSL
jgi:hypothetical protein